MDLRELERATKSQPNDQALATRLAHAWVRNGRGWRGDRLPWNPRGNMAAEGEVFVWRWLVAPLALLEIPVVYVPGGATKCSECFGTGWISWHGYSGPERDGCTECEGGVVKIDPFYIGRFPVTWAEYRAFCFATVGERLPTFPWEELRPEHERHPVVRVSHRDAMDFCSWAGLRLPTRSEWHWAAIGPLVPHPDGHVYENEQAYEEEFPAALSKLCCLRCEDRGAGLHERPCLRERHYPWGDEPYDDARCVWSGHSVYGTKSTAPVAVNSTPVRPTGASWCGAHDMAGNVWEWRADGSALGGSFRTEYGPQLVETLAISDRLCRTNGLTMPGARDDIGFRVAISAVED